MENAREESAPKSVPEREGGGNGKRGKEIKKT